MRGKSRAAVFAGVSATALLAASCSSGTGTGANTATSAASSAAGKAGGSITVRGCNPEHPLIPADTNESCGSNILDLSVAKLIKYNPENAAPEMDIAESIESADNQTFTVKLKKDYKFSDGTPVLAKNFVDAWNYSVANALQNEYFFEPIQGYKDTKPPADKKTPAKAKTMSGLKVVDDHTFEIKTTEKVSNLKVRLGYNPFAPLPDAFFKDPKAFGNKPIGAGPYTVTAWNKNQDIKLTKNPSYSGKFGGKVDNITFKIFSSSDAAYNEVVANNLDATDEIPTSAMIGDKYKTDLPGRAGERETGGIQTLTFPPVKADPNYANPKLRQAISMAIDRDLITKQIFNGARTPADGWVSPVVDGYKKDQCGQYCKYDPAKAKQLFTEAGGVPGGKITIAYNADAAHKDWVEATCNTIKNALGAECVATPVTDFATLRAAVNARTQKGPFRSGWIMDYPSIENFLTPLYATGASSNDSLHSSPQFDAKIKEAAAADTLEKANALYQEAEVMLQETMPAIPLWYYKINYGWSDKVDNVKATAQNEIDYANITLK
ncbi:MAG: ABC transporter substrate-binding protein [Austwickia sp.]|nr:ABC transporter substrate-binding protein [Austwickia sp.]